jgi:hypothetical protein
MTMTRVSPRADASSNELSCTELEQRGEYSPRVDCELMNHMNVIIGFAKLLAENESLGELHRRYASHIATSGVHACATLRAFFKDPRADSWAVS